MLLTIFYSMHHKTKYYYLEILKEAGFFFNFLFIGNFEFHLSCRKNFLKKVKEFFFFCNFSKIKFNNNFGLFFFIKKK